MAIVATSPSVKVAKWQRSYAVRLIYTDLAVIVLAVFGAEYIRFGTKMRDLAIAPEGKFEFALNYSLVSLLLVIGWMLGLHIFGTRDYRVAGSGSAEYKLILDTTVRVFGLLAIIALVFRVEFARAYLLIAFPSGLLLLLVSRWLWRKWLIQRRIAGKFLHRAVVLGEAEKVRHVTEQIGREPNAGFKIIGEVSPDHRSEDRLTPGMHSAFGYQGALGLLDALKADTLILTSSDVLSPKKMRYLGWELEQRNVELVVAPALTDIAGPRIHQRPVAGLPLLHIEYPEFSGQKYWVKRVFDVIMASLIAVIISPILITIAILVKRDSPGPIIFKQERVGHNGAPFKMLKFRSMVNDAEEQLDGLLDQNDGNGVLFKLKDDPRITKTGGFLRRYSLDELPQLFNVIRGDMSLVGPRPPLPQEVDQYDEWTGRRLLVNPGITGLWQVSGRSDLSWEDSVRLDLYYVENWSMMGDLIILYRTIRTVVRPDGAY